jgi:hypothetical protein
LRQAGFYDGRHFDVLVFGILREELEAQRQTEIDQSSYHFPFTGPPDEPA